jgi:hypothetical protein
MDKKILWLMGLLLAGGVSVRSLPELPVSGWKEPVIPLTNIEQVKVGMTSDEVAAIMDVSVDAGYVKTGGEETYEQILVQQPYAEEVLETFLSRYRVLYYVTYIRKADGKITDDELTPLVFENDRLIGMGRDFLDDLKHAGKDHESRPVFF